MLGDKDTLLEGKGHTGATKPPLWQDKKEGLTMVKKTLYIAYGSNLNLEQMAGRCPTAMVLGGAKLKGYQLLFRGGNASAVATVEKLQGASVPVLIWELEPADEAALDRYEGFPTFYRKETVKVRYGGRWIEVMVYIMNSGRPLGLPSRYYYDTILKGYESAGFDTSILNKAVRVSTGKEA